MKWLDLFRKLTFRPTLPKEPEPKVAQVAERRYPVLEKYRSRYSPETSLDGEELYCNGMAAEDGSLRIYRDRLLRGCPVVEVHAGDEKIDLRDFMTQRTSGGVFRHPQWACAQKLAVNWLIAHDCPEVKAYRLGFWVYDPSPEATA